jgi:hypothetical protein
VQPEALFDASDTSEACTRGISVAALSDRNGVTHLLLDCEGLENGETGWHQQLAAFTLHTASCLVFVVENTIQNDDIKRLSEIVNLATIADQLAGDRPSLLVVINQNKLKLMVDKKPATPLQFFASMISDPKEDEGKFSAEDVKVRKVCLDAYDSRSSTRVRAADGA